MTTPRRRLSTAMKRAVTAAQKSADAQKELHNAFLDVYGFDLSIEELGGDELVDALVYGQGVAPSLGTMDRLVLKMMVRDEA